MKTKKCPRCGQIKNVKNFNKNKARKDGLSSYCNECQKEYSKYHYNTNKQTYFKKNYKYHKKKIEFINRYKQMCGCKLCGEKRYWVLDFHHQSKNKEFHVTSDGRSYSFDKVKEEIRKCIVLCSNCHRDLHYKEIKGSFA